MTPRGIAGALGFVVIAGNAQQDGESSTTPEGLQPSPAAAIAVPADYAGDCGTLNPPRGNCGYRDIGLKGANGIWYIDLAANGLGRGANPPPEGRWDRAYASYGSTGDPVPADYDGDYKEDLAVKDTNGVWYIDYAANSFGSWTRLTPPTATPRPCPCPTTTTAMAKPIWR
jgi:hypothetical protein